MTTYVRFRVGNEQYAIPVAGVREVITMAEVTPVPGAQPAVLGVRNLRGQILPVIDLAGLLRAARPEPAGLVMITECENQLTGLAIDEVSGVTELPTPDTDGESPLLSGSVLAEGDLVGVVHLPGIVGALATGGR